MALRLLLHRKKTWTPFWTRNKARIPPLNSLPHASIPFNSTFSPCSPYKDTARQVSKPCRACPLFVKHRIPELHSGSFPKPLTSEEERHYLARAAQGDLEARRLGGYHLNIWKVGFWDRYIYWKVLKNKPKRYWKVGSQRKSSPLARGSRTHSDRKVQWEKNRAVLG